MVDDFLMQGLIALSVLMGPLFRVLFPLGFGRTCTSRMMMRSGGIKPGLTPAEQAEVDRRQAEKKKEREERKKQKEEEIKKKMQMEEERMKKEMKERLEKKLKEEMQTIEEEESEEGGERLIRRRTEKAESSRAGEVFAKPLDRYDQYAYTSDGLEETEEERDIFVAKLATVTDQKERDLMLQEKRAELHTKMLAAKRQELDERKRLHAEGARLQHELQAQKDKQAATEEKLALLTERVLHTKQEVAAMNRTLQKVESHQYEFEGVWNTFLQKSAKDVDLHIQSYIQKLDNHITQTFTPAVIEKIIQGSGAGGGGGGDGDGDGGEGDRKGKRVLRDDKDTDVRKIKVKVSWTYTSKREESVLHWIAAIESYVYGQRIPYWDKSSDGHFVYGR
ncbi:hypothetical protein CBR_g28859 [Chara braunii]|uniref:Uncharacterized protein n=1 Tax=Chara braunii TaxID=69332 RepID=A0A388LA36_CHABU|nr:hypothetical protein CBR_g28859 [Chara braunii]|eukprot:GBG79144.1 hypothetical protein CBR_g28859 [Chara braunii]